MNNIALRYVARRSNVRKFSTVENVGITDDTVQLLLRAHGRALLRKGNIYTPSKPPEESDNNVKVSVQSVLEAHGKQEEEQQKPQRVQSSKAMDLAVLLGSLKPVTGDTAVTKKSEKWEKIKERVARRRQVVVPEQTEIEETAEKPQEVVEMAEKHNVVNRPIELDVPSVESNVEVYSPFVVSEKPAEKGTSSRSKLSAFIERLKNENAATAPDVTKALVETPTRRLWSRDWRVTGATSIDQEAWNTIQALDLADDVEGADISVSTMKTLVRSFSPLNIINDSIQVLNATKDARFMPWTTTSTLLVCLLLKSGEHGKAEQLVEELLVEKLPQGIYLTLIDAFERVGDYNLMYTGFLEMLKHGYQVDADTTERYFSVLLRSGRVHHTFTLFVKSVLANSSIRAETCNFLINCLGKSGNTNSAARVFDQMRAGFCTPKVTSYNILIKQYVKESRINGALKMFRKIKKDKLVPNVMSYHYLISGLCKLLKKKQARRRFDHMKKVGLEPDILTYTCLVNCYGKLNEVNNALELFEEMKRKNVALDTKFFNALLRAVGRSWKPAMAYNIFREMKFFRVVPDLWTYNLLFHALAREARRKRAERAWKEMKEDRISPDVITYTALIHCFGNAGKIDTAYNMLQDMSRTGCEPNVRTWNALLKGIAKEDMIDFAFTVYKEMKSRGYTPDNTTYSILLDLCLSLRDTRRVLAIQRDFRDSGLEPDTAMTKILQRSIRYMRKERLTPFDPDVLLKP